MMRTLSGGNQQKLVLAREMTSPIQSDSTSTPVNTGARHVIIVENPTRGLDVRATTAVHDRLRAARDGGAGVVIYSSDLDEVLAIADRVVVLHAGTLHEVPLDRDLVGRTMLGIS
jgi:simple sugar transport system ATP-binding protein